MDQNGYFQYISPSFTTLLEYDISEMKQMNFFEKIHPKDSESVKKTILSYCSRTIKKALKLEFLIAHKKGHYINVEANISGITEQSFQKDDMILIVMREIHNHKQTEQAIYQNLSKKLKES